MHLEIKTLKLRINKISFLAFHFVPLNVNNIQAVILLRLNYIK